MLPYVSLNFVEMKKDYCNFFPFTRQIHLPKRSFNETLSFFFPKNIFTKVDQAQFLH